MKRTATPLATVRTWYGDKTGPFKALFLRNAEPPDETAVTRRAERAFERFTLLNSPSKQTLAHDAQKT